MRKKNRLALRGFKTVEEIIIAAQGLNKEHTVSRCKYSSSGEYTAMIKVPENTGEDFCSVKYATWKKGELVVDELKRLLENEKASPFFIRFTGALVYWK